MNSKINLNEISDFLSNLRKDKTILSESTIVVESVLQKPYPESDLHSLTIEELSTKLNEARREQHRILQFSAQEIAHLKFVDEAVSILEFIQSAGNTFVSSVQKSKEAHDKGDAESARAYFKTAKKSRYHMNEKDLDQATPHFKAYKELQKKYDDKPNVAESEELDELSNVTLGKYKSAAGKAASAADAAGDYKTGNKRFSGIMKATKKQFANDAKALKKESADVELDESNITTVSGIRDIRPGTKHNYEIVKSHGIHKHETGQEQHVYTVKRPNGFHGVLVTDKNKTHVIGQTFDNHSKEKALEIAAHYKKHGQIGMSKHAKWYIGGDKIVKESEELDEASIESKIASLEKKIQDARDAIGLAREKRKMKGQRQQGPREIALQKKIDDMRRLIDDIERSAKNESEELDEFVEYKNLAIHSVIHKQKQSNLAAGVEHLAKKNTAMTAYHAAKKAGNHEEAAKHLETANAHHATAMKHHDAVQELSKKIAALHKN